MSEPADHPGIQRVRDAAARKGVTLEIRVFGASTHTAEEAAVAVGAELGQIVKSLVFAAPGDDGSLEPILCLVSGPNRVDLGPLAAVTGEKDVRRATAREANELTGFSIGGIPPIGHPRPVRVVMDPDLGRFPAGVGGGRDADGRLPRRAGDTADARQRGGRSDHRGAPARRAGQPGVDLVVGMTSEPRSAAIDYPGGIHVRFRWAGSGQGSAVFALSETGGPLTDHGSIAAAEPDRLCRAELRVETPAGPWTARLASQLFDDPAALLWDTEGLLVVRYGFLTYAFEARTGVLRWTHRSGSPVTVVLGSSRLPTSSSRPRSRPLPSAPTARSPGGSRTRTWSRTRSSSEGGWC